MYCALLTRNYRPAFFEDLTEELHGLTIYFATDVPLLSLDEPQFRPFIVSSKEIYTPPLIPHFRHKDDPDYDLKAQSRLVAFRGWLQYCLEFLFHGKVSHLLAFQRNPSSIEETIVYNILYDDCDLYIHPDAESLIQQHLLSRLYRSTLGASIVRSNMFDDSKEWIDGLMEQFVALNSESVTLRDSPRNRYLFFNHPDEISYENYLENFMTFRENARRNGWYPLTTDTGTVNEKKLIPTPDGYLASHDHKRQRRHYEIRQAEWKLVSSVIESLPHTKNILGQNIIVTARLSDQDHERIMQLVTQEVPLIS
jgi:hypothetical protein